MGNFIGNAHNYVLQRTASRSSTVQNFDLETQRNDRDTNTTQRTQPPTLYFGASSNWIFGGGSRPDMQLITSLSPPPQVHQTTAVTCPVNLNRNSLQLVQADETSKTVYRVKFTFDCTENTLVQVLYAVTENVGDDGEIEYITNLVVTNSLVSLQHETVCQSCLKEGFNNFTVNQLKNISIHQNLKKKS